MGDDFHSQVFLIAKAIRLALNDAYGVVQSLDAPKRKTGVRSPIAQADKQANVQWEIPTVDLFEIAGLGLTDIKM